MGFVAFLSSVAILRRIFLSHFIISASRSNFWITFSICLIQVIKELVAHALAFMSSRNQASNIKQLNRHKPVAFNAVSKPRIALCIKFPVNAINSYIAGAVVRLYCGERIICNFHIRKSLGIEESALSAAWFSDNSY